MGIDIDPVETVEELNEDSAKDARNERLNALIAITVAVLAVRRRGAREKRLAVVAASLVVLAVLFGLYRTWSGRAADRAGLALGNAIKIANAPVTTGTPPPGESGPTFPTERERAQRAVEEFRKVAAEHGDPHRELARYFAAANLLMVERDKGVAELEGLTRSGNDEVAARARFALAQAHEADQQYDQALALYNELLKDKNPVVPADTINFRIAAVHEREGRRDEAADILFRMVEEARKAKDKDGKPVPLSTTAREATTKLETLHPERYAQLTPEPSAAPGNSIQNMPF